MKPLFTLLTTLCIISTFWLMSPEFVKAQSRHLTAQNIGLGGGGTAYQDLYHANFINPANLMINHSKRPAVTVGLAGGIYSNVGGSLVNIKTYNDYLTTGRVIEGATRDNMLNQWFGENSSDVRSMNMDVGIVPLGIAVRNNNWSVSITSRARILGNSGYSRGLADLIFRGFDADHFAEARAVNTNQEFLVYNEISAGFAITILKRDQLFGFGRNVKLHVGVAPKLLMGVNYARLNLDSSLQIEDASSQQNGRLEHNFNYSIEVAGDLSDQLAEFNEMRSQQMNPKIGDYLDPSAQDFTSFKGQSLGFDFGATLEMDIDHLSAFNLGIFKGEKKIRLGVSLTDVGSVKINDRTRSFSAADNFTWEGIAYDSEIIDQQFGGDENKYFESVVKDSIGSEIYGNLVTKEHSEFSKPLPMMLNIGTHLLLGKFSIMADVGTGYTSTGTNSERMHVALGTEYRLLNRIPLRVGYRSGGHSSATYHAGTGLEFRNFEFSAGIAASPNSEAYGSGLGAAWSGLVIHF
ncbi:DUF5723 family protein [Rhodohalobacter sp. 8-1]|uniref:DUF5723 family protein n=1 Tax=Rhodohalobacter sp. 8-1 TaxID=3131972 RepID=UPI0030EE9411